jgi:diguanylate cyclase (GGDEF)-like protein
MTLARDWQGPTGRFLAPAAGLVALVCAVAWLRPGPAGTAIALLLAVVALAAIFRQLRRAWRRGRAGEQECAELQAQVQAARAEQQKISADLGLLGNYGNLLLGSTDLAEALQISQQMLSQLLPECAGSIYPLVDGEGLAEVTHLWGTHVGETRMQASAEDCRAMVTRRPCLSSSDQPGEACPHIQFPADGTPMSAVCIPLNAQTESLGWLYLTTPGLDGCAKMVVAQAATKQLSQALANLKLRGNLRDLSVRDPLTGLFNRRYLQESLGREMARGKRRGLPLAVMMFDLDHFKAFNDNFGHAAGDAVLVAFGRLLGSSFRSEDIACRLGGEEFVLIMPEMELAIAKRRAQELIDATAALSIVHEGQTLPPITTSIGLAIMPEHGEKPDPLMAAADQALYVAKSTGRNRFSVAGESIDKN